MSSWATPLSASILALVAVLTYLFNQHSARRERKAKFYAEALLAIKEFEEYPYRVAKRPSSGPEVRSDLGNKLNDAYVKVSFYRTWIRIDSKYVADAYDNLARRASRFVEIQIKHAWAQQVMKSDTDMGGLNAKYYHGTKEEENICVMAMRRDLRPLSFGLHWSTNRTIKQQQQARLAAGELTGELVRGSEYDPVITDLKQE